MALKNKHNPLINLRNEIEGEEKNDFIKVEGSQSEGKYIIRRQKSTEDNENDQNLSDDSGFFIMYRNDNDKNWTISKTKNNFNKDKDYQNNIDSLDITTPRSKKTSFLLTLKRVGGGLNQPTATLNARC